jgi:hypothetical protein
VQPPFSEVVVVGSNLPVNSRKDWRKKFKHKIIKKPEGTEEILSMLANDLTSIDSRAVKLYSPKTVDEEIIPNLRALLNLAKKDRESYRSSQELVLDSIKRPNLTRFLTVIANLKGTYETKNLIFL